MGRQTIARTESDFRWAILSPPAVAGDRFDVSCSGGVPFGECAALLIATCRKSGPGHHRASRCLGAPQNVAALAPCTGPRRHGMPT